MIITYYEVARFCRTTVRQVFVSILDNCKLLCWRRGAHFSPLMTARVPLAISCVVLEAFSFVNPAMWGVAIKFSRENNGFLGFIGSI